MDDELAYASIYVPSVMEEEEELPCLLLLLFCSILFKVSHAPS